MRDRIIAQPWVCPKLCIRVKASNLAVETLLREAIQMCFNNGMLQGSDRVVVVQKTEDGVTAKVNL